jgi:hypothetical protein
LKTERPRDSGRASFKKKGEKQKEEKNEEKGKKKRASGENVFCMAFLLLVA